MQMLEQNKKKRVDKSLLKMPLLFKSATCKILSSLSRVRPSYELCRSHLHAAIIAKTRSRRIKKQGKRTDKGSPTRMHPKGSMPFLGEYRR